MFVECPCNNSYHELLQLLDDIESNLDVIGLCETFLTSDQSHSSYSFPGYKLIVKNRVSLNRRGVGLLIKHCLKYEVREDLIIWLEGEVESNSVEVEFNGGTNLISTLHWPPSDHWEEFVEGMNDIFSKVSDNVSNVVMADFNFNLLDLTGHNVDFLNLMISKE